MNVLRIVVRGVLLSAFCGLFAACGAADADSEDPTGAATEEQPYGCGYGCQASGTRDLTGECCTCRGRLGRLARDPYVPNQFYCKTVA